MNITLHPLTLSLRYPFTLGNGSSRTHTPVLLIELSHEGHTAYGEAAMPPYLGEDHHTATAFINRVDFGRFSFPFDFADIHQYLDDLAPGNSAAKAGIDLALHDLDGKLQGKPLWEILGSDPVFMRPTAYTVGIDTPEIVADKVIEATPFNYIKVKLGSADDLAIITAINEVNSKPLYADVNQGWKNKEHALELVHWLKEKGVVWIEQPFAKDDLASQQWLMERSPLPIFCDEGCQRLTDIERIKDSFTGINIKLMKSTGLFEAKLMLTRARELGLQTLIGCMTETSCATMAAAALAPQFDYVDIDGPWMLAEQPFLAPDLKDGRLVLGRQAGLGIHPIHPSTFF